jgi:hypothetical protein
VIRELAMNTNSLNETELIEVLQIAQDGESKLKEMSDYATIIAEKWRVKAHSPKSDLEQAPRKVS